ncbi:GlxA family transcriptional regulator [Chitinimonas lacunae]|uniref:GlxA family transcriptional regulator n=1 Tax=Chitinimonas lacunae TaxID=1963018 RepID=A0ABV8MK32_9NEIS
MSPIPVYLLLLPGVLMLDYAGCAEALRLANKQGSAFTLHHIGPEPHPASSLGLLLGGVEPMPDHLPDGAWIVVPGQTTVSIDSQPAARQAAVRWLRGIWREGLQLVTICSGALLAAQCGLLDGRRCTTHHSLIERLRHSAPNARIEDDRVFVIDGPFATSAGITTGIDLTLELLSRQLGPKLALDVAREMVVWLRRDDSTPQLSPWLSHRSHLHPAVHRVQDAIAAEPTRPWQREELAAIGCVSARHLSRLFRQYAGISLLDYQHSLQLALVEPLLRDNGQSLERIAESAGFGSVRDLRRVWGKQRGTALRRVG